MHCIVIAICCFFILPIESFAGLGMHGAKTVSTTNTILYEFTSLTADASVGATSLTVASSSLNANSRFSGNLAAGELVMIIQMQGATMNTSSSVSPTWGGIVYYNNAGLYEFNEVASVPNSTTISLVTPLLHSYTSRGNVQVIRVPRYSTFTLNAGASVTTQAWNGTTGGVLTIEVNGATTVNGVIDASDLGFRGGKKDNGSASASAYVSLYASTDSLQGGEKGEGIGGSQTTYDGLGGRYGRGGAANGGGGGNSHNAGGGGGANYGDTTLWNGFGNPDTSGGSGSNWKTAWDLEGGSFHSNVSTGGGRGGYSWSRLSRDPRVYGPNNTFWNGNDRANVGGYGGRPLYNNSGNRIFMGGGGGAGDGNNNVGAGGGSGGGIIYILSGGAVTGSSTDTIRANGSDGASVGSAGSSDAAGGAGGGGSVIVFTNGAAISDLTIEAKGGKGGDQIDPAAEAEGPGGGGGGGYIATTNANSLTTNANGGKNGTTTSSAMTLFTPNGATLGRIGTSALMPPNPFSGVVNLPVTLKKFYAERMMNAIELTWITASEINNDYFSVERSGDGVHYFSLGRISGIGNSTNDHAYRFVDDDPIQGDNYYRLSQTDFDGKTSTLAPIQIYFNKKSQGLSIVYSSPNPFRDFLMIQYHSSKTEVIEVQICNPMGQLIRGEKVASENGINSFFFADQSDLKSGVYIVQLKSRDEFSVPIKIVKN